MKNVKDISRAIFINFKKYVFNLFEEESKINKQHKGKFEKISVINIDCYNIYKDTFDEKDVRPVGRSAQGVLGIRLDKDDFVIELRNPDNLFSRISISNRFLKNWLENLRFFETNIENINHSWDDIIMDTFIGYLNEKGEFH